MRSFIQGLAIAAVLIGPALGVSAAEPNNQQKAQQLAKVLRQSGKLKGYRVGVKYVDGVAWLAGSVTSQKQKQLAEQIIRSDAGVERVISKLEIVPTASRTNQDKKVRRTAGTTNRLGNQQSNQQGNRQSNQQGNQQSNQLAMRRQPRRMAQPMPRPYSGGPRGVQPAGYAPGMGMGQQGMAPQAMGHIPPAVGQSVSYDNPQMPGYAWPSYAASPNYAALTYPKQYSPSAWPYIGPFYPYPQVPLGWRKVSLEWDDGWWFLDFKDQ